MLVLLTFSYSESRPLHAGKGSGLGVEHVLRGWLSSLAKEKPYRTSRLSPSGPDPRHH